jgi:heat shock protein HtpX
VPYLSRCPPDESCMSMMHRGELGLFSSKSLVLRSVTALILMIGFYALAVGVAGLLLYVGFHVENARLEFTCLAIAAIILWSLIPRRDRFVEPGPRLLPDAQPRLFERLNKLSKAVGQAMPREVYLLSDMNAWVMERGGVLGFGRKRVMGIGMPLLQVLSVSEFEAVLAHEFGHYDGGDTKLGPLIYRTRAAIGRTVNNLSKTEQGSGGLFGVAAWLVQKPFYGYAVLFLRITYAISRAQEFAADRLAARVAGAPALANGLRAIHKTAAVSDFYLNNEVLPVVRQGFQPPVTEGLSAFLKTESIIQSMDNALEAQIKKAHQDPYDTHPPLAQRLAAIEEQRVLVNSDSIPAIALLEEIPSLESQLVRSWLPPKAASLKPVQWSEAGETVWIPVWKAAVERHAATLDGMTLGTLPEQTASLLRRIKIPAGVPPNMTADYATNILGAALACTLHRRGWTTEATPGVLQMNSGTRRINPFDSASQVLSGKLSAAAWHEQLEVMGLDGATRLT